MRLSATVLGTTTVTALEARDQAVLLQIGTDTFTRGALARVHCWNFTAAANLSAILAREVVVKDTRALFETVAPSALIPLSRLGVISFAVLSAVFEIKRLGGDRPLEAWVKRHAPNQSLLTFGTVKGKAIRAAKAAARTTRRRRGHLSLTRAS